MSKRALICGISGQDGTYLAKQLLERGYEVWGSSRDAEQTTFNNARKLGIYDSLRLVSLNLRDVGNAIGLLKRIRPQEVYSLAGQSSVGLSFEQPVETIESLALGALTLLEAIRLTDAEIRLYNAGSTECFGDTGGEVANESTRFNPRSPYAVAKASAYWTVANYREAYGMFACTGILSNHDSPLRPMRFVTRKIIHAVASLAMGKDMKLALGNLDIERDWGWAPEYVQAIAMMLEQPSPEDFIIATGQSHTEIETRDVERQHASGGGEEHPGKGQEALGQRIEQAVEQADDEQEADRHNERQALLGFLQVPELAGPEHPIAAGQPHGFGDALLRFGDRAAEVAVAHAELDGDEALGALVINPGGPGLQANRRQFAQGDVGIGAAAGLIGHLDIANLFDRVPLFRREADGQVELAVALEDQGGHGAAHRRLDDRVHVARVEAVAGGLGAVHLEVQVRLAQDRENPQIGNAAHLADLIPDLGRQLL